MTRPQHHGKFLSVHRNGGEGIGKIVGIRNSKIGGAAANVLDDCSVHPLSDVKLDAGMVDAIRGDAPGRLAVRDGHDARDYDLSTPLTRKFAQAADRGPEIV